MFGLPILFWCLLFSFALCGLIAVAWVAALDRTWKLPKYEVTRRKRREWKRERADLNPAFRRDRRNT